MGEEFGSPFLLSLLHEATFCLSNGSHMYISYTKFSLTSLVLLSSVGPVVEQPLSPLPSLRLDILAAACVPWRRQRIGRSGYPFL